MCQFMSQFYAKYLRGNVSHKVIFEDILFVFWDLKSLTKSKASFNGINYARNVWMQLYMLYGKTCSNNMISEMMNENLLLNIPTLQWPKKLTIVIEIHPVCQKIRISIVNIIFVKHNYCISTDIVSQKTSQLLGF